MSLENTLREKDVLFAVGSGMKDFLSENLGKASNAATNREIRKTHKLLDSYIQQSLNIEGLEGLNWYQKKVKSKKIKAQAREVLDLIVTNYDSAIHNVMTAETPFQKNLKLKGMVFNALHDYHDLKEAEITQAEKVAADKAAEKAKDAERKQVIGPWYARAARAATVPVVAAMALMGWNTCDGTDERPDQRITDKPGVTDNNYVDNRQVDDNQTDDPLAGIKGLDNKVSSLASPRAKKIEWGQPTNDILSSMIAEGPYDEVIDLAHEDREGFPIAMDRDTSDPDKQVFYTDSKHDVLPMGPPAPKDDEFTLDGEIDISAGKDYQPLFNEIVSYWKEKGKDKVTKQDAIRWFIRMGNADKKSLSSNTGLGRGYELAKKKDVNLDRLCLQMGFNSDGVWRRYTDFTIDDLGESVPGELLAMARSNGYLGKKRSSRIARKKPKKIKPVEVGYRLHDPRKPPRMTIRKPKLHIGSILPRSKGSLRPAHDPSKSRMPQPPVRPSDIPEARKAPVKTPYRESATYKKTLEKYVQHVNTRKGDIREHFASIIDDLGYLTGSATARKLYGNSIPDMIKERCNLKPDGRGGYKTENPSERCLTAIVHGVNYAKRLEGSIDALGGMIESYIRDIKFLKQHGKHIDPDLKIDLKQLNQFKQKIKRHGKIIQSYTNTGNKVSDLRKEYGAELDKVIAAYGVEKRSATLANKRDSRMFQVQQMYESGTSVHEIAENLGVSQTTVRRDMKKALDTPYLEVELAA